jgi:hypothetical protein
LCASCCGGGFLFSHAATSTPEFVTRLVAHLCRGRMSACLGTLCIALYLILRMARLYVAQIGTRCVLAGQMCPPGAEARSSCWVVTLLISTESNTWAELECLSTCLQVMEWLGKLGASRPADPSRVFVPSISPQQVSALCDVRATHQS